MSNCDNFSKTKKVGKCGTTIWLGTLPGYLVTGTEQLLVTYYTNGDEVSEFVTPIITAGNDVFLDLTDPYVDYYNPYVTYFISLTNNYGYYSDGIQITNDGLRDGFIVNFGNASNTNDRLVVV